MVYGIQLYGIADFAKKDMHFLGTELRKAGISKVEPFVALSQLGGFENIFWTTDEWKGNMEILKGYGLDADSVHLFSVDLIKDKEKVFNLVREVPVKQIVLKCPSDLSKKSLLETASFYMQLADKLADYRVKLVIHNDAEEIRIKIDGITAYEWLVNACLGKVGMQVDIGWLGIGGEDAEAFLWAHKNEVTSIHYKDFADLKDPSTEVRAGRGVLDIRACFQFARAMGIYQIFDQDKYEKGKMEELAEAVKYVDSLAQMRDNTISYLNVMDIDTGKVTVLHEFDRIIEAPNWLKKENAMIYNSNGQIYRYDIEQEEETLIESGECDNCNNDHVVSPDEQYIAVSHGPKMNPDFASYIYIIPIHGGKPQMVTHNSPSFLHGWSPDGRELCYCAFRFHDKKMEVDVYSIPVEGGKEKRLTFGGFNDGPEYSPDGKYIWFNSTRTGLMQIWRLDRATGEQMQITKNERNNWFAHVSPDNTKIVYLSYEKDELLEHEHLPNMQVELWMMDADGSNQRKILSLFGGQGSINVNSWSKDSRQFAFVSYQLIHK